MMSVRLHIVVEGQTEETYVNRVLAPHLAGFQVWVDVRAVETGRRRGRIYRGGIREYRKLRDDLLRWMRQDDRPDVFFTTMIDLYGLHALRDAFPGWHDAAQITDPYDKVASLHEAWRRNIDHPRFFPYLQLHEFEALLLASPSHLRAEFIGYDEPIGRLDCVARGFDSPELIDDGEHTAPSKRIIAELPQYAGRKASAGPIVAESIGLEVLRGKCPHFAEWLSQLEILGTRDSS